VEGYEDENVLVYRYHHSSDRHHCPSRRCYQALSVQQKRQAEYHMVDVEWDRGSAGLYSEVKVARDFWCPICMQHSLATRKLDQRMVSEPELYLNFTLVSYSQRASLNVGGELSAFRYLARQWYSHNGNCIM